MSIYGGPDIITDGLVFCLDAANSKSYPGTGTAWTDLSGNDNNGTLTNGPTFDSSNGGSIVFDGVNDQVNCGNITEILKEKEIIGRLPVIINLEMIPAQLYIEMEQEYLHLTHGMFKMVHLQHQLYHNSVLNNEINTKGIKYAYFILSTRCRNVCR